MLSLGGAAGPALLGSEARQGWSSCFLVEFFVDGVGVLRVFLDQVLLLGYGSKRCQPLGTTGFGHFFLLPIGFFRYPFLTHSHWFLGFGTRYHDFDFCFHVAFLFSLFVVYSVLSCYRCWAFGVFGCDGRRGPCLCWGDVSRAAG